MSLLMLRLEVRSLASPPASFCLGSHRVPAPIPSFRSLYFRAVSASRFPSAPFFLLFVVCPDKGTTFFFLQSV